MTRSLAIGFLGLFLPDCACAQGTPVPHDIFRAWRQRDAGVKGIYVAWKEKVLCAKETLEGRESKGALPERDFSYDVAVSLRMENELVRYEREGLDWFSTTGKFLQTHYTTVFGGGESTAAFWERDTDNGKLRIGIEMEGRSIVNFTGPEVQPILLAIRAADPHDGLAESDWTASHSLYEGKPCQLLVKTWKAFEERYVVDAKTYSVLQRQCYVNGQLEAQMDIAYRTDPIVGRFPKSWHSVVYVSSVTGPPRLHRIVKGQVIEYKINPPSNSQDFRFEFPTATHVSVHPHSGKNSEIQVYVKTETERRFISASEAQKRNLTTYQDVIGAALKKESTHGVGKLLVLICICAATAILLFCLFKYKKGKKASPRT